MEQIINVSATQHFCTSIRKLKVLLLLLVSFALTGCIPEGGEHVNTELFKNKQEVSQRADKLHNGMSEKAVFDILKINPQRFDRMTVQAVQMSIYGNSQVHGTPAQLEAFRQRLAGYKGYSLPYRDIKADGTLGFGSMKITKTGCDLQLVLIFNHGKLIRATVEGTQQVQQVDDQNVVPSLLGRALGFLHL